MAAAAAEKDSSAMPKAWVEAPTLKDLLPELSRDEQLRREKRRVRKLPKERFAKVKPTDLSACFSTWMRTEDERDAFIIGRVQDALFHYNARHKGGEFDAVKPLMEARVSFRGQIWFHLNFWARSRSTNIIKRFFAEVHYMYNHDIRTPVVEICTIIQEPLSQHRSSCAFCPADLDILHPKGSRKFVCGNDKDRFEQRLEACGSLCPEMPFSCPPKGTSKSSYPSTQTRTDGLQ